jgi:hypothetical protein
MRHVSMYFFMYRTHIRCGQPTIFTLDTCEGDAECVEALGKRSDVWKDARPTQGADGAEEVPGALRVGEQLAPRALKWLCLPLHGHPAPPEHAGHLWLAQHTTQYLGPLRDQPRERAYR